MVSVIIATYNCAKYLSEAIDSALNQTYQDFEIIIVDDGSSDNTKEILKSYIYEHPKKIRYFHHSVNKGLSATRNEGIKESRGEFITFLDADDKYLPQYLEKCINFLLKNINYNLVITEWHESVIDDKGDEISRESKKIKNFPNNSEDLHYALFLNFFLNSYMLARKVYLDKIGYFDENIFFGEDVDLWRRLTKNGAKIGLIQEPLFIYRKRKDSLTTNKNFKKLTEQFKLIEKYREEILADKYLRKHYSEALWDLGRKAFYLKGKPGFIFKCMLQSQIYRPSLIRALKSFHSLVLIKI